MLTNEATNSVAIYHYDKTGLRITLMQDITTILASEGVTNLSNTDLAVAD